MYYARELFVKKGPLGTIWLAGNFIRKVSKSAILHANVVQLCQAVEQPPVALALPTQATLLRGVVRIEQRKAVYLLDDAIEAKTRVRVVEREQQTLPTARQVARYDVITYDESDPRLLYPDTFLLDAQLQDIRLEQEVELTADREIIDLSHQSLLYRARDAAFTARPEDITLSQLGLGTEDMARFDREMEAEFGTELEEISMMEAEEGGLEIELPPEERKVEEGVVVVRPEEEVTEVEMGVEGVELVHVVRPPPTPVAGARRRRRRKPVEAQIDVVREISDEVMRAQLMSVSDLLVTRPSLDQPFTLSGANLLSFLSVPTTAPTFFSAFPPSLHRLFTFASSLPAIRGAAEMELIAEERKVREEEEVEEEERRRREEEEGLAMGEEISIEEERAERPSFALEEEERDRREAEGRRISMEVESLLTGKKYLGRSLDESIMAAERRVSGEVMREEERRRRTRGIGVGEAFPTPEVEVPSAEFEMEREEGLPPPPRERLMEPATISAMTTLFRSIVMDKLQALEEEGEEAEVEFEELLRETAEANRARVTRVDGGVSFFQLLVLRSLDIVGTKQEEPFGPILIAKGPRWEQRFSQSTFTPSQ